MLANLVLAGLFDELYRDTHAMLSYGSSSVSTLHCSVANPTIAFLPASTRILQTSPPCSSWGCLKKAISPSGLRVC